MPKGYLVVEVDIPDLEAYRASGYMQMAEDSIARHGGKYIVRGGDPRLLEGEGAPGRIVVLEFPSREAAEAFHASADYGPALKLRSSLSTARNIVLTGTE